MPCGAQVFELKPKKKNKEDPLAYLTTPMLENKFFFRPAKQKTSPMRNKAFIICAC
jgi:hypothetical protein